MPRKNTRNTKGKIVSAAWKLFYEQGYEETTVEDIIFESGTSRGSFYHYFGGKDALLSSLSYLFDEKYEELEPTLDEGMSAVDKLAFLNRELFSMIDSTVSVELMAGLLSSQLVTKGERHLMDRNRLYFKLLHRIIREGQEKGEVTSELSVGEIVKAYAMYERALMYDWCLYGGEYPLARYASDMMPRFLNGFKK